MAQTKTFTKSFSGGEVSPAMFGRLDDAKVQSGAALLRNFIVTPQGPAQNRPGFQFVKETKNGNDPAKLIPFTYSSTQTMVLEFGPFYIRFHTMGETLQYSNVQDAFIPAVSVTYTIASPAVFTAAGHGLTTGQTVSMTLTGVAPVGSSVDYPAGLAYGPYVIDVLDANTFELRDAITGNLMNITAPQDHGGLAVQFYYGSGSIVSFGNQFYYRPLPPPVKVLSGANLDTNPASDGYWSILPSDLTYEIPSPYDGADLFDIHYAQSADVMTLVHPSYPVMELARLGPTLWTIAPEVFGAVVDTPQGVVVTPSPGYLAQIASYSIANPAVFTTKSSHTLALGDPVYINGLTVTIGGTLTDLTGFYLVNNVPIDSSGNLVPNELSLMDYSGNTLDSTSWTPVSNGNIQYGTKIFNINSFYGVVAIGANGIDQSLLSTAVSTVNNLDVPGSYNVITWIPVGNASRYYVFKQKNGLWGYIGQAVGTSFTDTNIAPDFSISPTNPENPFDSTDNYPAAVGYIEQRKIFGGTNDDPQTLFMTNSGTESTFSYSLPSLDTDRIQVRIASLEASAIKHVVPLVQLLVLTESTEYAEFTTNQGPITPNSIGFRAQSYVGSSNVQPKVVNNLLVYCAARGGHVREMGYDLQSDGYITGDLSLRAAHLFDLMTIQDMAFSKAPLPILWFVSSSGQLLGLTYIPEQQIGAWHHHDTIGNFESICCVVEGDEERLYAVIERMIDGNQVRYVERMASRLIGNLQDCFFVDAGSTYSGTLTQTISGLTWLEGATVSVLADGAVQTQKVVTNGEITLDQAASVVQVGLPYTSDLQTLPVTLQMDGYGQGRKKNINKVWLRVYQSSGIFVGPDENNLVEFKQRTTEPYGDPPSLRSGEAEITLAPQWNDDGQLLIRQVNPLPLEVVGVTIEVSVGG
jgi:hypothetical protein